MEKIVGADLITVDSCISSAWTVRDTVTNYKVRISFSNTNFIFKLLDQIYNWKKEFDFGRDERRTI